MLLPAGTATNKALALLLELCRLCTQVPRERTFTQAKIQASMIVQSRYLLLIFIGHWELLRNEASSEAKQTAHPFI